MFLLTFRGCIDCSDVALYLRVHHHTMTSFLGGVAAVNSNINGGSGLLKCLGKPARMHNTVTLNLKQLNGIQPSLILLFTPVLFPL